MHRRLVCLSLLLSGLAGCEACPTGPDLDPLFPSIELVDPEDRSLSPCLEDNVRQCEHNFGDVRTDRGRFYTIRVLNDGDAPLAITDLNLEGDPAFTLVDPPVPNDAGRIMVDEIKEAGAVPLDLTVRFTPQLASTVQARLILTTDAGNLEEGELVVLIFTGTGLDVGGPKLVVNPSECAFGEIGVGATGYCDLTFENIGDRDLQIDDLVFTSQTPLAASEGDVGFGLVTFFISPTFIGAGTATGVRLHATPAATTAMSGVLQIVSNDPDTPVLDVNLSVIGADVPTAVAEIFSVNGVLAAGNLPVIRPLDDVVLTGENSLAASAMGAIEAWSWEIVDDLTDDLTTVTLTTPNSVQTGFSFESAAGTVSGVDVVGTFVVRLTVTDDGGRQSSNDARVTFTTQPAEALHVQLTWDSPDYDIDVHMTKDGGQWCNQSDSCYYGNCKPTSFFPPEWDGVSGRTEGDPSLDIDDLDGYGPENINIDLPVTGGYRIGVHAFSSALSAPVYATLKIYINGALAFEDGRELLAGRDFWEVAQVDWLAGSSVLFPVGNYSADWSCP